MNTKDLTGRDVAEHRDFLHSGSKKLFCASTSDQVGEKTQTSEIPDTGLSRFRLLFTTDDGNEGHVNESKVFVADSELELAHGLNERHRFNVTHGTTELTAISKHIRNRVIKKSYLDNTDIRLLASLVHRNLRNSLDPVLDGVGQVRDDLNSFSQVISTSLNHTPISISSSKI